MSGSGLQAHQGVLLELLTEFDRICRANDIGYVLFAGSALGAVRHQGFIPWDDDLDVAMLRADYERFLQIAPCQLGGKYYLQGEFSAHWPMFFSKLRKNGTACMERFIPRDEQMHQGIYLDIFPVDNLSDSGFMRKLQFAASKVVIAKGLSRRGYLTDSKAKKLFMAFCRAVPMAPLAKLARLDKKTQTQNVHTFFGAASRYEKNVFPRVWFAERAMVDFEGKSVPISAYADEMLTLIYGDYRTPPPEEERRCKVHGVIVDTQRSYEAYLQQQKEMKVMEFARSIR
jgi:lipopolysaccharide cholinephosphotransferase